MKKAFMAIAALFMACIMLSMCAVAAETEEETKTETETPTVFTTEDGVLSIRVPADDDNWKVIDDPNSWFAITDGLDLIAVDHIANGDSLPAVETANDKYAEIFQVFYSTRNEVFVVTGRIADSSDVQRVREAVSSFRVLKYDTIEAKKPEQEELIAGGQIFSGASMTLYDPQGGSAGNSHSILVDELNQGGWVDQNTGIIYYPLNGGKEFQGTDGSFMVTIDYFN